MPPVKGDKLPSAPLNTSAQIQQIFAEVQAQLPSVDFDTDDSNDAHENNEVGFRLLSSPIVRQTFVRSFVVSRTAHAGEHRCSVGIVIQSRKQFVSHSSSENWNATTPAECRTANASFPESVRLVLGQCRSSSASSVLDPLDGSLQQHWFRSSPLESIRSINTDPHISPSTANARYVDERLFVVSTQQLSSSSPCGSFIRVFDAHQQESWRSSNPRSSRSTSQPFPPKWSFSRYNGAGSRKRIVTVGQSWIGSFSCDAWNRSSWSTITTPWGSSKSSIGNRSALFSSSWDKMFINQIIVLAENSFYWFTSLRSDSIDFVIRSQSPRSSSSNKSNCWPTRSERALERRRSG